MDPGAVQALTKQMVPILKGLQSGLQRGTRLMRVDPNASHLVLENALISLTNLCSTKVGCIFHHQAIFHCNIFHISSASVCSLRAQRAANKEAQTRC